MGLNNNYSDYGSGSSMNSDFQEHESWLPLQTRAPARPRKCSSFADLVMGRCTLDDVMKEFRLNGSDAPYIPDEDLWAAAPSNDSLLSRTPSSSGPSYLRQTSWPAPDLTPSQPLPRLAAPAPPPISPRSSSLWPTELNLNSLNYAAFSQNVTSTSTPINYPPGPAAAQLESLTDEQKRVLASLPDDAIYSLLREIEIGRGGGSKRKKRIDECRFCKNNGERESFYRSHTLKDDLGRVACPVLRAFVCRRCGASGDTAHTAKYCPMATLEERHKSAAMMRSVRMASGKRRSLGDDVFNKEEFVLFGVAPSSLRAAAVAARAPVAAPLDPQWAALEQKLLL